MFDVESNGRLKVDSTGDTPNDPLLLICKEFWILEQSKAAYLPGDGIMTLSAASYEEFHSLQRRLTAALARIRELSATSLEAGKAKLKILTHLAAATEFQDSELFREIVGLLDDTVIWPDELGIDGMQRPKERPNDKKTWKLNILNFFGNWTG